MDQEIRDAPSGRGQGRGRGGLSRDPLATVDAESRAGVEAVPVVAAAAVVRRKDY